MTLAVRTRRQGNVAELYLTVSAPGPDVFGAVATLLRERRARILQERVVAPGGDIAHVVAERRAAYGDLDDGVSPTWLSSPGPGLCLTVHAVAAAAPPISMGRHARLFRHAAGDLLTVSAVAAPGAGSFAAQADAALRSLAALLQQSGTDPFGLARTWFWVESIHERYAELNAARTGFFRGEGLIGPDGSPVHLPASTGVGLRPAEGSLVVEAVAQTGGARPTTWIACGNQGSALRYGSAFSRAARLSTPTGDTFYVSGTAAIDGAGATVGPGDAERQVRTALDNLGAVFRQLGLHEEDVVQGTAYAASSGAARAWGRLAPALPIAVVFSDLCRRDLLFEVEVTVCPGASADAKPQTKLVARPLL